ncbi:MAG: glycosyltransferase family 2 protein [candidate division Zixibacteria bacterium]|nr:glycosyltransferase family 2 protein [candidate division Zixibacteria bacterium]
MTAQKSKFELAVVMPVLNEEKFIGRTLEQLYQQDFPMDKLEIVIADGGSTDRTCEIVESYKSRFGSLKLLTNPTRRPSSGLNAGVKNSTAPYIVVIDGHVHIPGNTLLRDIVDLFQTSQAACLCRLQPPTAPGLNEFELSVALCRSSLLGHRPGSEICADYEGEVDPTSFGSMWTRETFDRIGYFDEQFDACEDVDFNHRVKQVGLKSYLSPKLTVFNYPRSSLQALWQQMFRYGFGRFRFARKHNLIAPVQWITLAGVVGMGFLLLLSFLYTPAFGLFKSLVALYLLVVVLFSAGLTAKEKHLGCLLYGPLIFPTIHIGLGAGFLSGLIERLTGPRNPRSKSDSQSLSLI